VIWNGIYLCFGGGGDVSPIHVVGGDNADLVGLGLVKNKIFCQVNTGSYLTLLTLHYQIYQYESH